MLDFEEYKATFNCDLSKDDFEKIMQKPVSPFSPDVESIMIVDRVTKEKREFVPVVRCKDCSVPHNKYTGCPKLNGIIPKPDFFCGHGERRLDDA